MKKPRKFPLYLLDAAILLAVVALFTKSVLLWLTAVGFLAAVGILLFLLGI